MSKILVIEDNADIRNTVIDVLTFNDFEVVQAEDGIRGFEVAKNELPDLVLCDVLMPRQNGWETLEKFRSTSEFKHTPFVFTTALSRMDDMRKGMGLGADDYITKPFDNHDLVNTIRRLLLKRAHLESSLKNSHQSSLQFSLQSLELQMKEFGDSLERARIVQQATLPTIATLEKLFDPFLLMYAPKDTVSGDFYWANKVGDTKIVAVADCTGHGIPGALMTMACTNMLNFIVNSGEFDSPKKILEKANQLVLDFLHSETSHIQDGMDISMCAINSKEKTLHYVGAQRPLFLLSKSNEIEGLDKDKYTSYKVENKEHHIHKIKGGRFSIGSDHDSFEVVEHQFNYNEGDTIYLSSDGLTDQFGGDKGKKFNTKRLIELLKKMNMVPISNQQRVINSVFEEWKGDNEQVDDVTLMGIQL